MASSIAMLDTITDLDKLVHGMSLENSQDKPDKKALIDCCIARSVGKLQNHLTEMDDHTKTWIGVSLKYLNSCLKSGAPMSWDSVLESMMSNPILEPEGDAIYTKDMLNFESSIDVFKTDETPLPDDPECEQTEIWISKLINDTAIMADLAFKDTDYAQIVAHTVAAVKDFGSIFYGTYKVSRPVLDVGVLRYPDMDHPYFKVYRLQVHAWKECKRVLMVEKNKSGIKGSFNCQKFKPRDSVVRGVSESTKKKAIDLMNNLFD